MGSSKCEMNGLSGAKVPMTKSEVRTVSLSKLELYEDCEFWDIGAGTGSVSVEAAVSCPGIHVCAFEYKEEAVELIRQIVRKPEQRRHDRAGKGAGDICTGKCSPTGSGIYRGNNRTDARDSG